MPLQQFGEWRPDVSDFQSTTSRTVTNVLPRGDGYGPFNSLSEISESLGAVCRGAFNAYPPDGSVAVFAATVDRIFLLNNSDLTWRPVSQLAALTSISEADPAVVTYTSHPFAVGDRVVFRTDGALPTGLTAGTVYYVIADGLSANEFQVSETPGGAGIETTSAGAGNHFVAAAYPALTATTQWQFRQFGNLVIAVQGNVTPQVYNLSTSTEFDDLAGAPQANYIDIVGQFVVLSGLVSKPYRIQWCGLGDATQWTSGVNSSDYQDFPDGGMTLGVAGGESGGIILQQQAIRRMTYAPGNPLIFVIDRIAQDKGLFGPYSLVRAGERVFFYTTQGFFMMQPGGFPEPIGRERFDRTFFEDLDKDNLQLFIGVADPRSTRVFWAYKSVSGIPDHFDKVLCYDWALQRATSIEVRGQYIFNMVQPGTTLDALDSIVDSIDDMIGSLDDLTTSITPELAAFGVSNKMAFFRGAFLEARLETPEIGTDGRRIRVNGFRPITDAQTVYGSAARRETVQAIPSAGPESLINPITGRCDMIVDTRYSRLSVRIPADQMWSFVAGVEPDIKPAGLR